MSEFIDYLHEVFRRFGPISSRRMFGGHGIYHQGLMFALVADDILYLKADNETREQFTAAGVEAFVYLRKGQPAQLSYYQLPEEAYEDEESAVYWARLAYAAALRGAQNKSRKKPQSSRNKKQLPRIKKTTRKT